jgi:hypothetical protein
VVVEGKLKYDVVSIAPITKMIELVSDKVECVVFNSCYSEAAIGNLGKQIEYAVLMSDAISDDAAIKFASSFYAAVGDGTTIERAFFIARTVLELYKLPDADLPRLYRGGTRVAKLS